MNQAARVTPRKIQGNPRTSAAVPPMPDYNARVLGYLVFAAIIVSGILTDHFSDDLVWLVPPAMLWPHILFFLLRYLNRERDMRIRQYALLGDSFLAGNVLVLMEFSLNPTLFLLLILNYGLIIVGGMRIWLYGNAFFLGGFTVGSIYFGLSFQFDTPTSVSLVSGLGATLFIAVTAYYTHQQARALVMAKSQIQEQREKSIKLSHDLAKYLSPQVWQTIFTGEQLATVGSFRRKMTVFFSDIKGFTTLSEELEPENLTELINQYFNEMSQIAIKHGGTIDKFIGDSIMIFFGDPNSKGIKGDALACVAMAIEMRKHMTVLKQKWRSQGVKKPLEIRIGINTGYCTVGNFGAENRMDYTVIGKEVNLASRLEGKADPGEIRISYSTFSLINDKILTRDQGEINVKGFHKPIPMYSVIDYRRDFGGNESFIEYESEGFAMHLDESRVTDLQEKANILKTLERAVDKIKNG